jgi:hypothetical protein
MRTPSQKASCTVIDILRSTVPYDFKSEIRYYLAGEWQHATLQREVSTSSTWDGGSVEPLVHSQHGAIVKVLESLIKSHVIFIRT